jgi:hypothetical protein
MAKVVGLDPMHQVGTGLGAIVGLLILAAALLFVFPKTSRTWWRIWWRLRWLMLLAVTLASLAFLIAKY